MKRSIKKKRLYAIDDGLGLITPTGRRAHERADINLRQWARGYLYHDRREIMGDTGNGGGSSLGRDVKRNNKDNNVFDDALIEVDDSRYVALNAVVLRLPQSARAAIHLHYVERDGEPARAFIQRKGLGKTKYYEDLSEAKQAFIAWGGINN